MLCVCVCVFSFCLFLMAYSFISRAACRYQGLDLSGNRMSYKATDALSMALPDTCFELDLSRNAVPPPAISSLSNNVFRNQQYEVGAFAFALFFSRQKTTTHDTFSGCFRGQFFALIVSVCFIQIFQLNLASNGLREDAIRALTEGIGHCGSLKRLNLANNR